VKREQRSASECGSVGVGCERNSRKVRSQCGLVLLFSFSNMGGLGESAIKLSVKIPAKSKH